MLRASASAAAMVALSGCGPDTGSAILPGTPWPRLATHPENAGPDRTARHTSSFSPGQVIRRSVWTRSQPIAGRVNPMGGVTRITMHHEGATDAPVYFTDTDTTIRRLQQIHRAHLERGWGDIGYHYVIDRAGRIWEARPLTCQGAHVRNHNEHNIAVMCLGNFDIQTPSDAQLDALRSFVGRLRRDHHISTTRLHTHQELVPTRCPGSNLQPRIARFRNDGLFA